MNEDEDEEFEEEKEDEEESSDDGSEEPSLSSAEVIVPDEMSDEEDEELFTRLEHPSIKYDLEAIHPEIRAGQYEEIVALSKVVRDPKTGQIVDPLHRTLPFLTKYEKARIIGSRAEQIEGRSTPFVTVPENVINGRTIALLEFEQKKIPFIIARPLPNGGIEYWRLQDLEFL